MIRISRAAFVHTRRSDAGYLAQLPGEICRILLPRLRLLFETGQLLEQQRPLEFRDSEIAAVPDVGKAAVRFSAPVVLKAAADLHQVLALRQQGAALARVEVFR